MLNSIICSKLTKPIRMTPPDLWSFTFDYPFAILFTFVPALINFGIFVYVSFSLPKNRSNNTFAIFVLLLGIWQLMECMVHSCRDPDAALVWYRMSGVASIGVAVFEVLFALRFTGWHRKISYALYYCFLVIPAIVLIMFTVGGFDSFVISGSVFWHWIASPATSIFTDVLYGWIALASLVTLLIYFFYHIDHENSGKQRKRSLIMLAGFAIPVIGGIACEVIAPLILHTDSMPITTPLITCFSVAALIAIRKYGLLDLSPRHQWENILKTMNEGLVIVDMDHHIVYTNNRFDELLGYSSAELQGKLISELISDPTSNEIYTEQIKQRRENLASHYQLQADKKDGSKIWLSVSGFPYLDKNGEMIGSVGVLTDVTELMHTQIQLKSKINDLNLFFYKTSHDFKTPIASMQGLLECYEKDDDTDELLRYIKMCIQNLSLIVGRVSQLSIIQQKQIFMHEINNKEYIDKIVREIKSETPYNDVIKVNTILHTEKMNSETYLMHLILKNLIENGIKYYDPKKPSPSVMIAISTEDDHYRIIVSDNGLGIEKNIQDKVFDMFFRGNDQSKGPGLGLYIVKSAVEKLNGKVSVKSEPGQGTEFVIHVPIPGTN